MYNVTVSKRMNAENSRTWTDEEELFLIRCYEYEQKATMSRNGLTKSSWNAMAKKINKKFLVPLEHQVTSTQCRNYMDTLSDEYIAEKLNSVHKPRKESALERARRLVVEEKVREEEQWEKDYHAKRRKSKFGLSQPTDSGLLGAISSSFKLPFQTKKKSSLADALTNANRHRQYDFNDDDDDDRENNDRSREDDEERVGDACEESKLDNGRKQEGIGEKYETRAIAPEYSEDDRSDDDNKETENEIVDDEVEARINEITATATGVGSALHSWKPPSVKKARKYHRKCLHRGGMAPIGAIDYEVAFSGEIAEFFRFVRVLGTGFLIMSVLCIPSLVLAFIGSNIDTVDHDGINLYRFTIGNIGDNISSFKDNRCRSGRYAANDACVRWYEWEVSMAEAQLIVMVFEFFQVVVYIFAVYRIRSFVNSTHDKLLTKPSVKDYSIMVTNIPDSCTVEDLVDHFSNNFQLFSRDARNRRPVLGALPVENIEHSGGDLVYKGKWVAEVTIHTRPFAFIEAFQQQQRLIERFIRCSHQNDMYGANSMHKNKENAKRKDAAKLEQEMLTKSMEIGTSNMRRGIKILTSAMPTMKKLKDEHSLLVIEDLLNNIDARPIAAFVTFQYSESLVRCLSDYEKYSKFPWNICYPHHLKLFGDIRLHVQQAPDPEQIIWKNLEISRTKRVCNNTFQRLLLCLLLIGAYVIVLPASNMRVSFYDSLPNDANTFCSVTLPDLYSKRNNNSSSRSFSADLISASSYSDFYLTRGDVSKRAHRDEFCNNQLENSFFAVYFNASGIAASYTGAACSSSLCPLYQEGAAAEFCPCVSTTEKDIRCETRECVSDDNDSNDLGGSSADTARDGNCTSFPLSDIGLCFCHQKIVSGIDYYGVFGFLNELVAATEEEHCADVNESYLRSALATVLTPAVILLYNWLINVIVQKSTKSLYFNLIDDEKMALISVTLWVDYVQIAVVIVLSYAYIHYIPATVHDYGILSGPFVDFSRSWFGVTSYLFLIVVAVKALCVVAPSALDYAVWRPLVRWQTYRSVRNRSSHSMVTQNDLNKLHDPPCFDPSAILAQLLSCLFICMTFSAGVPLLTVLMAAILLCYGVVYRHLLFRYFHKPQVQQQLCDAAAVRHAVSFLPWAAALRLAVACWMFSCTDVFPHSSSENGSGGGLTAATSGPQGTWTDWVEQASTHSSKYLPKQGGGGEGGIVVLYQILHSVRNRIFRPNVLPLFVLLALIMLILLMGMCIRIPMVRFIVYLPYRVAKMAFDCIAACLSRFKETTVYPDNRQEYISLFEISRENDPLRRELAPFTGSYFQFADSAKKLKTMSSSSLGAKLCSCCCFSGSRLSRMIHSPHEEEVGWRLVMSPDTKHWLRMKLLRDAPLSADEKQKQNLTAHEKGNGDVTTDIQYHYHHEHGDEELRVLEEGNLDGEKSSIEKEGNYDNDRHQQLHTHNTADNLSRSGPQQQIVDSISDQLQQHDAMSHGPASSPPHTSVTITRDGEHDQEETGEKHDGTAVHHQHHHHGGGDVTVAAAKGLLSSTAHIDAEFTRFMTTYEVIASDGRCPSYRLCKVPEYRRVLELILRSAAALYASNHTDKTERNEETENFDENDHRKSAKTSDDSLEKLSRSLSFVQLRHDNHGQNSTGNHEQDSRGNNDHRHHYNHHQHHSHSSEASRLDDRHGVLAYGPDGGLSRHFQHNIDELNDQQAVEYFSNKHRSARSTQRGESPDPHNADHTSSDHHHSQRHHLNHINHPNGDDERHHHHSNGSEQQLHRYPSSNNHPESTMHSRRTSDLEAHNHELSQGGDDDQNDIYNNTHGHDHLDEQYQRSRPSSAYTRQFNRVSGAPIVSVNSKSSRASEKTEDAPLWRATDSSVRNDTSSRAEPPQMRDDAFRVKHVD